MHVRGKHLTSGRCYQLSIAGELIASLVPVDLPPGETEELWFAPGLVDLQVNGIGGREFTKADLSPQDVTEATREIAASGVLRYCPTLTTQSDEVLLGALAAIARACRESPQTKRHILGVHLEGPYISPEDGPRGAHPRQHVRPPDWDHFRRLQEAAEGRIRIVTLSPEYDNAPDFIRRASDSGLIVAIGHTRATGEQLARAVDAGAKFSTHLGNGSHAVLPRHPNYLWDQLAEDRLWASLITDGHHLPGSVVKSMLRAKGLSRLLLVSDITALGGSPPGVYPSGLGQVEVLGDGRLVVAGQRQYLAGAALPLDQCVARATVLGGISLPQAWQLASSQPLRLLGEPLDEIAPGAPASFVLFRWHDGPPPRLEIVSVYFRGTKLA